MEYTFKTKQMIQAEEKIGNYIQLQEAVYNADIGKLAKLIMVFGNVAEEKAFEYIDEQLEQGNTIKSLYEEIFKGINEKGFFNQKLDVNIDSMPIDMTKLTMEMYEKYMNKEIEKQIALASNNM